jgi:hypothetical protein
MKDRLSPSSALQKLAAQGGEFIELFRHGSLVVEVYRPSEIDRQQPHSRDELWPEGGETEEGQGTEYEGKEA